MSDYGIEPLHAEFGARVSGLSLRAPLARKTIAEVHDLIDRHSFLCFPGQELDDALQLSLTCSLGEPEEDHVALGQRGAISYFGTIGNVQEDGSRLGSRHRRTIFATGNNLWHTDSSFRTVPSYVSIMSVHEVPEEGGQTQFASARAAYARLPEARKAAIDPLVVIHDYVFSRSQVADDAVTPSHAASLPPVRQKLVRTNPRNGAKNYYVGSHAKVVEGWDRPTSRRLLDDLLEQAVGADHVYTHAWEAGQLVVWDNRCLLHRGTGYDADRYRRYMRQTRVRGVATLAEA